MVQQGAGAVAQVSPDVNRVVGDPIAVGNQPTGIAAGPSGVWVANSTDGTVTRIDPRSGKVTDTIDVGSAPDGVAVTKDTVWVANSGDGTVSEIDATSATLRGNHPVGGGPAGIAVDAGAVWVANTIDGTLARIDIETRAVTAIPVGEDPAAVAVAGGSVWVSNESAATLVRVDPRAGKVDRTRPVGGTPHGLAAAGGSLWVTAGVSGASHRGGTLRVFLNDGYLQTIDPLVGYSQPVLQVPYDGLVGIRRAAGAAGTTLVPNLATSIPSPVHGGKTYAFRLRKGIRYSTGAPVRASDLRHAFERLFQNPNWEPSGIYGAIRGVPACAKSPDTCDLSSGIQTDDAAGSVTFHLTRSDPEFLFKLSIPAAAAVPPGTPDPKVHGRPIPGTGPYMITRFVPDRALELVRNPYFTEWSHAAKPDGYPDRIVYRFIDDADAALTQVLHGKADLAYGPFPGHAQELRTRYAAQLHLDLSPWFHYMALSTTAPPFDDVRARRALNYAVDRDELVRRWGGSDTLRSSCQALPPGFPGYAPYCPYSQDLAKARRLVAASGTKGDRVTVVVEPGRRALGQYLKRVLESLGYAARLDVPATGADYYHSVWETQSDAQLIMLGWGADYPAASQFLEILFGCRRGVNLGHFCEQPIDAKIRRASALQQSQPAAAGRLWQQTDRAVVDRAAMLPLGIELNNVVTSRRVGNYLHQPGLFVLVDQLWVRSDNR